MVDGSEGETHAAAFGQVDINPGSGPERVEHALGLLTGGFKIGGYAGLEARPLPAKAECAVHLGIQAAVESVDGNRHACQRDGRIGYQMRESTALDGGVDFQHPADSRGAAADVRRRQAQGI